MKKFKKIEKNETPLTPKQKKLCENFVRTNDEEQSYILAGYNCNGNHKAYMRKLFNKPKIKHFIKKLREETYTDLSDLNDKYKHFVKEYLRDFSATRAYSVAISPLKGGSLAAAASQLLHREEIQVALQKEMNARFERLDIDADNLVRLLWNIANHDPAELFNEAQNLKSIKDMPIESRKVLNSFKIVENMVPDQRLEVVKDIKLCSRERAIELLMKWKGMLVEQHNIKGQIDHNVRAGVMIVPGILDENTWHQKAKEWDSKREQIQMPQDLEEGEMGK